MQGENQAEGNMYLVDQALLIYVIAICHDLDVVPFPHKGWEVRRHIVLLLDPPVVLKRLRIITSRRGHKLYSGLSAS